ncbi:hypothetical protein [Escherichia coli]|uniref:hypothetical protein n=1 Tax=Escherichia coli TaxID=562 RepID=UPI00199BECB0|nr:hypothetical protein [Escherichia coli]MED6562297.1 hypothetical protein [Escherichia coli O157]MED6826977.1 hypothetical protein [Escherichia coli O157]MED6971112.1 hypothetical protein [Escherichia coli O157]HAN1506541.1 hypothetical protein [Escherichia coli]
MANITTLSQLEALVKSMRAHADNIGVEDPAVCFCDEINDDTLVIAEVQDVSNYSSRYTGGVAKKGDFCLYLTK